ncbi:MAG: hypothetical protein P4L10_03830 [Acidobacteriaceae bacterium]|nr:hypothetical protein [Acidobacteriaceae bacterium]
MPQGTKSKSKGQNIMNSIVATNPRNHKPQPRTATERIAANLQSLLQQSGFGCGDMSAACRNAMGGLPCFAEIFTDTALRG